MDEWLISLVFTHLALTSVYVGSNPAHDNLLDSLRTCCDIVICCAERNFFRNFDS